LIVLLRVLSGHALCTSLIPGADVLFVRAGLVVRESVEVQRGNIRGSLLRDVRPCAEEIIGVVRVETEVVAVVYDSCRGGHVVRDVWVLVEELLETKGRDVFHFLLEDLVYWVPAVLKDVY